MLEFTKQLEEYGYSVFDLPDAQPVMNIREKLTAEMRRHVRDAAAKLETYHEFVHSDEQHHGIQLTIVETARAEKFARQILLGQLEFLTSLFGPDVAMTSRDNIRIVRPLKGIDNIGFHRDLDYGNTAYELNLFVPFVDLDEKTGISVCPASHKLDEDELDIVQTKHSVVTEGSTLHHLGWPHSPKIIQNLDPDEIVSPPVKIGQALAILPHCIHGQEFNRGSITRWSVDVEVCNGLAPINWRTTSGEPRFEILTESIFFKEGRRKHPLTWS